MPKVSIIVPSFNNNEFIGDAINSILKQTFTNYEIVVVDSSTDKTPETIRKFNGRIKYVYQPPSGVAAARNLGISFSDGEYIAFLDSDDLWLPWHLEKSVEYLDRNTETSMVYSKLKVTLMGKIVSTKPTKPALTTIDMWNGATMNTSTLIVRKNCFNTTGLFDENSDGCEDHDMWLRILDGGFRVHFLSDIHGIYRLDNPNSLTKNRIKILKSHIYMQTKYLKFHNLENVPQSLIKHNLSKTSYLLGKEYFYINNHAEAVKSIRKAISAMPNLGVLFFNKGDSIPNKLYKLLKPYIAFGYSFQMLLFHKFSRRRPVPKQNAVEEGFKLWAKTLLSNKEERLIDSAVSEICEYLSKGEEEVRGMLVEADKLLATEWAQKEINRDDEKSVVNFYNCTNLEIFDLMNWHYSRISNVPLQYVFAFDIAKRLGYKDYLDYGSGIGSGGILFAMNGFKVTLADISNTNLQFCKFRFNKRNLDAEFIDIKTKEILPPCYDFITCFDVLEHTRNPIKILKTLRNSLGDNGILIINTNFEKDGKRPMHIANDKTVDNKIRSLGFRYERNMSRECRKRFGIYTVVLRKSHRHFVFNKLLLIYDCTFLQLKRLIFDAFKIMRKMYCAKFEKVN